jgi:SH3-like domain-containing protein
VFTEVPAEIAEMAMLRSPVLLVLLTLMLSTLACDTSAYDKALGDVQATAMKSANDAAQDLKKTLVAQSQGSKGDKVIYATGNSCPMTTDYVQVSPSANQLNLRDGPGTNYSAKGYVIAGSCYSLLETKNSWVRINTSIGEGWVSGQYIEVHSTTTQTQPGFVQNITATISWLSNQTNPTFESLVTASDFLNQANEAATGVNAVGRLMPLVSGGVSALGLTANGAQCWTDAKQKGLNTGPCAKASLNLAGIALAGAALVSGAALLSPVGVVIMGLGAGLAVLGLVTDRVFR